MNREERRRLKREAYRKGGSLDREVSRIVKERSAEKVEKLHEIQMDIYFNAFAITFCEMFPKHKNLGKEVETLWRRTDELIGEVKTWDCKDIVLELQNRCESMCGCFMTMKESGGKGV